MGVSQGHKHLAVVVEHFLKVGDVPSPIHAVARKAPTYVVVDAPLLDAFQRAQGMAARFLV